MIKARTGVLASLLTIVVIAAAVGQIEAVLSSKPSRSSVGADIREKWNHSPDKTAAIVADIDSLTSAASTQEQLPVVFALFNEFGVDGLAAPLPVRQAACRFLENAAAGLAADPRAEGPAFCGNEYIQREHPVTFLLRYADHGSTTCRAAVAAIAEGTTYTEYVRSAARNQLTIFDRYTSATVFEAPQSSERDRAAALAQLLDVGYEIPTDRLLNLHSTATRYDTQYLIREYLIRRKAPLTSDQKKRILEEARAGIDHDSVIRAWNGNQLGYFRR